MSEDELELKPSASAVSSGSVDEFTSASTKRKRGGEQWRTDGIDVRRPDSYIPRQNLVEKAMKAARQKGFLVICSPPGTGKTSLSQLMQEELRKGNEQAAASGEKVIGFYLRPSSTKDLNLFAYIKDRTGVSFENRTLTDNLKDCSEVWLLFDDAHRLYGETFQEFWEDVLKRPEDFGAKTKVNVVILATHYLDNDDDSPVVFSSQPRIGHTELLLTKSEAIVLFRRRCIFPEWENLYERLFYLTKGTAAAFVIGLNIVLRLSEEVDRKSGHEGLTEEDALKELVENFEIEPLKRCFPAKAVTAETNSIIMDAIIKAYQVPDTGRQTMISGSNYDQALTKLIKAGILTKQLLFTSPVAQNFYFDHLFPRAPNTKEVSPSLDLLIEQAIENLSGRRLRGARQNRGGVLQSPKEAVFQQLFHESLASLLPVSYRIIPELGTSATVDGKEVTGELHFYVRNCNKWAIELLRDGSKLQSHLDRIPGKYRNVEATEWLVVDFRLNVTPRKREKNLCTLVFDENYESCLCYMRLSKKPYTLNLAA